MNRFSRPDIDFKRRLELRVPLSDSCDILIKPGFIYFVNTLHSMKILSSLHAIEIMPDHVHVFVQADHTTAPVEIAKTMKSISAVDIFGTFKDLK